MDPVNLEAQEGLKRCLKASYQLRNTPEQVDARIKTDPEIAEIIEDEQVS